MKLNKKITMGALAAVAVVAPIATVVSCGSKEANKAGSKSSVKNTKTQTKQVKATKQYKSKIKQIEGGIKNIPYKPTDMNHLLRNIPQTRNVVVDGIKYHLPSTKHYNEMKQKSKNSVSISAFGFVEDPIVNGENIKIPFAVFDKPATKLTDILWNNSFGSSLYKNKQGEYNIFMNYTPQYKKGVLTGFNRLNDDSYAYDNSLLIDEKGKVVKPANVSWKKLIFINGKAIADQDVTKIVLEKGDVVEIGMAFKSETIFRPFGIHGRDIVLSLYYKQDQKKYADIVKRTTEIIDPLAEIKPFFNTIVGKNGGVEKIKSDRYILDKNSKKSHLTSTKFLAEEKKKMNLINGGKSFAINVITPSEVYYAIFPANPLKLAVNSYKHNEDKVIDNNYPSIFQYLNNDIFNIDMGIGNQNIMPYELHKKSKQTTKTMKTSVVSLGGVSKPGSFLPDNSNNKPMVYTTDINKAKSFDKTEINKYTHISQPVNLEVAEAGKIYEITYNHEIDLKGKNVPFWIHGVKN